MKSILTLILFLFAVNSFGQDYYHGLGCQYSIGLYNLEFTSPFLNYSGSVATAQQGVFYKATLAFSDNLAVSAYPFLGINMTISSRTGGTGFLGFELPVNAEFFLGDLDDGCFFVGAGLSYAYLTTSSDIQGEGVFGPQIALGGQFNLKDNLYGIRAAYTIGINSTKLDVANANVTEDSKSLISGGIYFLLGK
jgi:hypothetical protein